MSLFKIKVSKKEYRTNEMRILQTVEGFYIERKYIYKVTFLGFVLEVDEYWCFERTCLDEQNVSGFYCLKKPFKDLETARSEMERIRYLPKIHN